MGAALTLVKYTSFQSIWMRRLPLFTSTPLVLSLPSLPRNKPTTLVSPKLVHSSLLTTDIKHHTGCCYNFCELIPMMCKLVALCSSLDMKGTTQRMLEIEVLYLSRVM